MSKIKIIVYNDMAGEKIARTYLVNDKDLTNLIINALDDEPKKIIKKVEKNKRFLNKNAHIIAGQIIIQDQIEHHKIWRNYGRKSN